MGLLQALGGIDLIVAVTFIIEVGSVSRFESPRQLMGLSRLGAGRAIELRNCQAWWHHQGR